MQRDPRPWWRDSATWAIGISCLAGVIAIAALVVTFRPPVQWGAVADWASAFGSILAAVVALGIAIHANDRQAKKDNQEAQNGRDRARRRAGSLKFEHHVGAQSEDEKEYQIMLRNQGNDDIYEVTWFPPIVATFNDRKFESACWGRDVLVSDDKQKLENRLPEILVPGQNRRLFVKTDPLEPVEGGGAQKRIQRLLPLVTFADADGYRLGRVYLRTPDDTKEGKHDRIWGEWAVVDDDYPASVTGLLREVLDAVTGEMPASGPSPSDLPQ